MRRASTCVAALALVLAGCGDNNVVPPTSLKAPSSSFDIVDGANGNGGNPHFYFLSPLVTSPTYSGTFDPNVVTNVDICELSADPSTAGSHCAATVESFTYADISVLVDQEMYKVNWNTTDSDLTAGSYYRIIVRAGSDTLGYRDVQPVDGPTSSSGAADIYNFNNGSTIPIKYRVEKGLLCDPNVPCNSGAITNDGGTVAIGTGGVSFKTYSLPTGYDAINVTVEDITDQLDGGECITGLDLPQFGPCLLITTQPELTAPLDSAAVVSLCLDVPATALSDSQADLLRVYRWDVGEDTVDVLQNVPENVCNQTMGMRQNGSLFSKALAAIGSFFAPPAYAVHTGLGSLTSSFSRFHWALPAWFSIYEGDGQVAPVNTAVADTPAVLVRDENGDPVENARVHWNVTTGGGTVVPVTVYSDAAGIARVNSWTLGSSAGLNTLDAWGFGISDDTLPYGAPQADVTEPVRIDTGHVQFTATACTPGYGRPQAIDGTMEPGEWACANTYPFTANLSGGSGTPATLYWMNDGTNLYLAVSVVRDKSDKVASLRFDFDHNGDGTLAASNDAFGVDDGDGFFDQFLTDKCINRSQAGCGEDDTADTDGTKDGHGAIGYDGTHLVYELSHPLNSGDTGHDFALAAGDSIGTFLTLQIGNGANGNTQIPGFRDWKIIHIQSQ